MSNSNDNAQTRCDTHEALTVSDLDDIQAGPVIVVPTKAKLFLFFTINDVVAFRSWFKQVVLPDITTTTKARKLREDADKAKKRGEDEAFANGQYNNAEGLGDTLENWLGKFKGDIDGLFTIPGASEAICYARVDRSLRGWHSDGGITIDFSYLGQARPDGQSGHEHFGFNDGISQPFIKIGDDYTNCRKPWPGQMVVNPGVLLLGHTGDSERLSRPEWTKNGSFLAYRHLKQLVPEFDAFLVQAALKTIPVLKVEEADQLQKVVDYIGARLIGCPVVLTPLKYSNIIPEDRPEIGKDDARNNDFDFGPRGEEPRKQFLCPFAAHIRKTGPRTDLPQDAIEAAAIMRSGIAYGPEVTDSERLANTTLFERGLLFACYQSNLGQGFEFLQKKWCNNVNFIRKEVTQDHVQPGFDPIIGQAGGRMRQMTGFDAKASSKELVIPQEFVVAQGGEYFFLPSITALKWIAAMKDA